MTDFCIQVHPHRSADLVVARVRSVCEDLAVSNPRIRRFAVVDGTDGHYYVNLMFETNCPRELWHLLFEHLYESSEFGDQMKVSSMAMCEGDHGWDDYLLLHHFNPAQPRDRFPEDAV